MQKILVDIKDSKINFGISGSFQISTFADIISNKKNIYRIQFSTQPDKNLLKDIANFLIDNPKISLRFYGNYSENLINWELLSNIERLFIDLWETNDLKQIKNLSKLKLLGISKNVKSTVSLKIVENLSQLEMFFTSISKDIESIQSLKRLKLLSFNEIKADNLNFLSSSSNLTELWISLGSIKNFGALAKISSLQRLSIHQCKGFDDSVANNVLPDCHSLVDLELMNLALIRHLDFISNLNNLTTINFEGIKNLDTFEYFSNNNSLKTLSGYNCRPINKLLLGLENIETIGLGDSYSKVEIDNFTKRFKGKNLWIRGKQIKGFNKLGGRIAILNE